MASTDPKKKVAAANMESGAAPDGSNEPEAASLEVIFASHDTEFLRGNQNPSGGWVHGPGHLELFKAADDRLNKLGMQMGMGTNQVTRVRLARIKGTRVIYVIPTHDDDVTGVQVNRWSSSAWINIVTLLGPARMTVKTGYRERFNLEFAGPDSPVGPALVMDMDRRLDRRRAKTSSKSKGKGEAKAESGAKPSSAAPPAAQDKPEAPLTEG